MTVPTVSIILPTFNRLKYLREAVESVFQQTFQDWELLVVDDGSGAQTQAYLATLERLPRIKSIRLAHTGNPPAVRNAALRVATGEYIAFLDSDDVWLPNKLETQIASLRSRTSRKWSYAGFVMVDGARNPLTGARAVGCPAIDGWVLDRLLKMEAIITQSSVVARRELIDKVGGYDEELPICGDYELWLRLALESEVDCIDEPLVIVRRHNEHYCDDVTACEDFRRALEKVHRSGIAAHLDSVLRRRRAIACATLAKSHAVSGNRIPALSALLSSAHYSWRYRQWWLGAIAVTARVLAPSSVREAARRYRRGVAGTQAGTKV